MRGSVLCFKKTWRNLRLIFRNSSNDEEFSKKFKILEEEYLACKGFKEGWSRFKNLHGMMFQKTLKDMCRIGIYLFTWLLFTYLSGILILVCAAFFTGINFISKSSILWLISLVALAVGSFLAANLTFPLISKINRYFSCELN